MSPVYFTQCKLGHKSDNNTSVAYMGSRWVKLPHSILWGCSKLIRSVLRTTTKPERLGKIGRIGLV